MEGKEEKEEEKSNFYKQRVSLVFKKLGAYFLSLLPHSFAFFVLKTNRL